MILRTYSMNHLQEHFNDDSSEEFFDVEETHDLRELRIRAKALGVKNPETLNPEQLEKRIQVMLKVRLEGLSRLEFDENKEIVPSLENLRILQIEAVQKKNTLTRADVIEKLQGYKLLTNKLDTTTTHWTRYIDEADGFLRAGGFPIRNKADEEFIVFKNVSKKFTFSVKRENVILMEKLPSNSMDLLSNTVLRLVNEFRNKPDGPQMVLVSDDFNTTHFASSISALSRTAGLPRSNLSKAFSARKVKYKNFFIFKLLTVHKDELFSRVNNLSTADKIGNTGINNDLMQIINNFYP